LNVESGKGGKGAGKEETAKRKMGKLGGIWDSGNQVKVQRPDSSLPAFHIGSLPRA
jgi:hypothetical protein